MRTWTASLPLATLVGLTLIAAACEPAPEPAPEWTTGLELDEEVGALLSVWGPSRDEVHAVGGNPEAGVLYRFDGSAWAPEALPAGFPLANWVYGFVEAEGTVLWIAGNDGMTARRSATGEWTTMDLGTVSALWGIWGAADDDVWTVGGNVNQDGDPVLAHWDGAAWTMEAIPALDRQFEALFKIWGTGPDDVFAVGHEGVVLHYDGTSWEQQLAGTASDLISLWGTGPNEIIAVGGRSNGVIARYDGSAWTSEVIGMLPGLNGVWIDAQGTAFAVGIDGLAIEIPAGSFEFVELDRSAFPDVLHGAFGFDDGARFGAGGKLHFPPPWTGVLVQYLP